MVDKKISELSQLTSPADADYVEIIDASETADASKNKRITLARIKAFVSFTPSKTNIYNAVKSIIQGSTNVTVTPDDTNSELDISASGGGGSQRSRQDTIDLLVGDDGGDIDFTRDGSGSSSDLRGSIRSGSVSTQELANNAVIAQKIGNNAVVTRNLADDAVTNAKIADDAVDTDQIADDAVETSQIANNAVTSAKLADTIETAIGRIPDANPGNNLVWKTDGSGDPAWRADATGSGGSSGWTYDVQGLIDDIDDGTAGDIDFSREGSGTTSNLQGDIRAGSVGSTELANNAVTSAKLGGSAVGNSELANSAVSTNKIADDAVTRAKIGAAAVGATELGTSAVTTAKIADDAVTTDKLANAINTVLGRVPSASPGNNQVWKTDGSGSPGWRTDATGGGSGSPVAVANPQALTPGTSTLQVGGATLGTEMPDNVSVQIPITSLGTGDLASGLSSNNFTLKAGAYLIFVHMDEIWNTTSSSNALQYRSTVALEITGTLPAGTVHDPMPHYFRGAIQADPAEAAAQAYVYLPADTEIGLALVSYPGIGEDSGSSKNLNYHCTIDDVHIFPMGGIKGDKGDKGDAGTGGGTSVSAHTPASGDAELAGIDIGGTDYEITDRESRNRLRQVEQRVHPILEKPQTWSNVTDSGVAGWTAAAGLLTDVAAVAALTYGNANVSGTVAQFVYVRILAGAQQSTYRFRYTVGGGAQNGQINNRVLGTWSGERVGADSTWAYYRISFFEGDTFSTGRTQLGVGSFEWEGDLTRDAVQDQLDAIGVPEAINALKNVTRDLHLDGATRLVKNSAAATAGVARVAIANSALQAIEAGTQSLSVQGVTFTATLANAHFGSTATTTDQAVIRLAQTEDRSDWRILFDTTAFLAGGWVPINVTNGTAGYDYYISGKVDRTTEIAFYKSTEETTYHGELRDGLAVAPLATGGGSAVTNIWRGSQTQYDAISSKDANVVYMIEPASS